MIWTFGIFKETFGISEGIGNFKGRILKEAFKILKGEFGTTKGEFGILKEDFEFQSYKL